MKNWIIVANKVSAKIFSIEDSLSALTEMAVLHNDKARLKESDLVSDSPGSSVNSSRGSGARAMGHEKKAVKHALDVYTSDIADYIKHAKDENAFDSLIIVAEPGMLGNLSSQLERKHLKGFKKVGKELNNLNNRELFSELHEDIKNSFPTK